MSELTCVYIVVVTSLADRDACNVFAGFTMEKAIDFITKELQKDVRERRCMRFFSIEKLESR